MIQGMGASAGIAIGKAFVLPTWEWELPEQKIDMGDLAREFERLYEGIRTSKDEIEQLKVDLHHLVGPEERTIFDAHIAILEDPVFMNEIQGIISRQYKVAEVAVKEAIDHFVTMFDLLDDEYMKERALDIRDVGNRLLKHLLGTPEITLPTDSHPFILIAKEISPSQLAHLNPQHVLGIVTLAGSINSHTAIMARALSIPLVVGVEAQLREPLKTGDLIIMDGAGGVLFVEPDVTLVAHYERLQRREQEAKLQLKKLAYIPSVTIDGCEIELSANLSSIREVEVAVDSGASGVGLFRTEFLYMDRDRLPTEEEQFDVYRGAAQKLEGKPLIVRTLDIGGDKQLDYFELPEEANPFLGYRAIRISLNHTCLFKTQLRAILRASLYGDIKIMYPLISSLEEVFRANELLREAKRELANDGIPFRDDVQVGIMIELPAAVMIADQLAAEVDFFSIGTNDLVQFTLAVDRMNDKISHLYEPYHPALLRMLKMTVDAAKRNGIHVGVCGEHASDPLALPIWLALGVDELSMTANAILSIKNQLLCLSQQNSRLMLERLWTCRTSHEIKQKLLLFQRQYAQEGVVIQ